MEGTDGKPRKWAMPTMATTLGYSLLSVPVLFMFVYPIPYFKHELRPKLASALASSWEPGGTFTLMFLFITAPIIAATVFALCLRRPVVLDVSQNPVTRLLIARTRLQLSLSEVIPGYRRDQI